jgi:hypothetical protein
MASRQRSRLWLRRLRISLALNVSRVIPGRLRSSRPADEPALVVGVAPFLAPRRGPTFATSKPEKYPQLAW